MGLCDYVYISHTRTHTNWCKCITHKYMLFLNIKHTKRSVYFSILSFHIFRKLTSWIKKLALRTRKLVVDLFSSLTYDQAYVSECSIFFSINSELICVLEWKFFTLLLSRENGMSPSIVGME